LKALAWGASVASEVAWQEDHAKDFLAIHELLSAVTALDFKGTTHTDWLTTVRSVRDKVHAFAFVIPNAPQLLQLLDCAEKALLAVAAVANLAKDANGQES
jgi:hypothetical protein